MRELGVLGCGQWGQNIVRDLVSLGCRVTVADPDPAARERARKLGAAVVPGLASLPAVEGVVVASPCSTHADAVEALLPRDVPIFVEKPFTHDGARARKIAALAPARVFVMHKWRYHPGVEALARVAAGQELGPVVGLELTQVGPGGLERDVDPVWTLAPHPLSIALAILGRLPEARAAVADAAPDGTGARGLSALLATPGLPWVKLEVSARAPERLRRFRLLARDGIATLTDGAAHAELRVVRPAGPDELRPLSSELPLLLELREFVAHLGGGPPPRCSAAEGALIVEAVERLRALAGLRAT